MSNGPGAEGFGTLTGTGELPPSKGHASYVTVKRLMPQPPPPLVPQSVKVGLPLSYEDFADDLTRPVLQVNGGRSWTFRVIPATLQNYGASIPGSLIFIPNVTPDRL